MNSIQSSSTRVRHASPPLGPVATVYTALFLAGLYPVTLFGGTPGFPGPSEPLPVISTFFLARPSAVLVCAALHFGAAIPLGIFTASVVSRLRFLGVRAAGTDIALFGGVATSLTLLTASSLLWAMSYPEVAHDGPLLEALYRLQFALGGPGFSVPLGLLIAGVSVTSGFWKLLPKWLVFSGLAIAVIAELSWLDILVPRALPLIPLTRFPSFVWLIAVGFALPNTVERTKAQP